MSRTVRDRRRIASREGVMNDRHLTVAELAEREGVPVKTVYTWNSQGTGPAYMRIGKHVRYKLADIVAWESARAAQPARSA